MAGVQPFALELEDFKDPAKFQVFQDAWAKLQQEVNRLAGLAGPVQMISPLDMQGFEIRNLGTPTSPTSALSTTAATPTFGPAVVQAQVEATGKQILQSTRRLNDQSQRELYSSHLNDIINLPPAANSSTITVVNNGATTTATLAAGTFVFADGTQIKYPQRADTIANPGANNFYFYYLRKSDKTVQLLGPYLANNSQAALDAYMDGRGLVGSFTINNGGGGSGKGGGTAGGGCLELGTPIKIPEGKKWEMVVEPCSNWIIIHLPDGKKIVAARDTRFAVFKRVQDLDCDDLLCEEDGSFVRAEKIEESFHSSCKMKIKVEGGVYIGAGVLVHNIKPLS